MPFHNDWQVKQKERQRIVLENMFHDFSDFNQYFILYLEGQYHILGYSNS